MVLEKGEGGEGRGMEEEREKEFMLKLDDHVVT